MEGLLKETQEHRVETEAAAVQYIEAMKDDAKAHGYVISKASYTKKVKKSKGEVIAEAYLVSITKSFGDFWEEL